MKVYLIKTPECEFDLVEKVADYLEPFNIKGPLKFEHVDYSFDLKKLLSVDVERFSGIDIEPEPDDISDELLILYKKKIPHNVLHAKSRLSFQELYKLCDNFRANCSVQDDCFVVLLTKWGNEFNFLSSFDSKRNIFVHVDHWKHFTQGVEDKFPIAHQIVENIMSSLMNIDFDAEEYMNEFVKISQGLLPLTSLKSVVTGINSYVHENPKGCINDLCWYKNDVILKLQSGNICPDCTLKVIEEVNVDIFVQATIIFRELRNEFGYKSNQLKDYLANGNTTKPYPLIVDKKMGMKIRTKYSDIEILLDPKSKALYFLLLQHKDGILLDELDKHFEELLKIYRKISPGTEEVKARTAIFNLLTKETGDIRTLKSNINKLLRSKIEEPLQKYYTINRTKEGILKIELPRELLL